MSNKFNTLSRALLLLSTALIAASACTRSSDRQAGLKPLPENPFVPPVSSNPEQNNVVVAAPISKTDSKFGHAPMPIFTEDGSAIKIPGGGIIPVRVLGGVQYIPVELALDDNAYTQIKAEGAARHLSKEQLNVLLGNELSNVVSELKNELNKKLLGVKLYADVGYAVGLMRLSDYDNLTIKPLRLSHRVLMNPLVNSPGMKQFARTMNTEGGLAQPSGPRDTTAGMSGLTRIGAVDFVAALEKELGVKIDGSSVKVGVTDTGVTFNHPTFFDAQGKSRIDHMKDFTGEGKVFFNPNAKFEISEATEAEVIDGVLQDELLFLNAEYHEPLAGAGALPEADKLSRVEKLPLIVTAELKALLLANPGARLGVLSERVFAAANKSELVDLNQNKKVDDNFWVLLIPNAETKSYSAYVDLTATVDAGGKTLADFRKATALGDFNKTKTLQSVHSEKFGLEIKPEVIQSSDGEDVAVVSAAIVGFDPGNHGSHVSGIIAGRKIISNDSDDTLARGVAPGARLLVDRVCANNGGCQASSAIIDLARAGARVINMSLGGLSELNDGYGVQETIVNRLTETYNTLFVISAGNSGPGKNTIGSPSVARHSLSIGATANREMIERQYQWAGVGREKPISGHPTEDFMLFFSSRGPTAAGGFKPNISAPGTELSSIQLNAAPGARAGLDVYWGTSMAAPTAAGAVALLMDAVTKYNQKFPEAALPSDALTLRRVIIESARPFDVARFNPKTGERLSGQYTWIDQGTGMINLPRAWAALKQARDTRLPSAVTLTEGGKQIPVDLDYQVRVSRKNPNGLPYDGSSEVQVDAQGTKVGRFGTGIWLDSREDDSFVPVQILRNLPSSLANRPDVGDLARQLNTTADEFELDTVYYGAAKEWLKAGTRNVLDCLNAPTANLLVVGQGAISVPKDPTDPESQHGNLELKASTLNVCINRNLVRALPAGDHGALIHAYRVVGGKRESHASFTVPVYISVPNKTLAGVGGYEVKGVARSFEVERHYVAVPEGTTLVEVSLEVDPVKIKNGVVSGCAGAELMILEGANGAVPPEYKDKRSVATAINCDNAGHPVEAAKRVTKYSRSNPKAGIWDVHVFGRYNFASSPYKLKIEFAKVESSVKEISGLPSVLNGEFSVKVIDASQPLQLSGEKSEFLLSGLQQKQLLQVKMGEKLLAPTTDGRTARSYADDIASVTLTTGGAPMNDLDLLIIECAGEAIDANCKQVGQSAGATDVEAVSFAPVKGKFYFAVVDGYDVEAGKEQFLFGELQTLANPEKGLLELTESEESVFQVKHSFDIASSVLMGRPEFIAGLYALAGDIKIASTEGASIVRIPVSVKHNE